MTLVCFEGLIHLTIIHFENPLQRGPNILLHIAQLNNFLSISTLLKQLFQPNFIYICFSFSKAYSRNLIELMNKLTTCVDEKNQISLIKFQWQSKLLIALIVIRNSAFFVTEISEIWTYEDTKRRATTFDCSHCDKKFVLFWQGFLKFEDMKTQKFGVKTVIAW